MPRIARTLPDGRLVRGDLRDVLPRLPEGLADLVYFDPPFGTGRDFGAYDDRREALDVDLSRILPPEHRAHAIVDLAPDDLSRAWLRFMASCLVPIRGAAKPSGSIWIHVDERSAHLARLLAESLLAPATWRRTVIWRYRRWPTPQRSFQAMHDVLLWFAGPGHAWKQLHEPLSPKTVETHGTKKARHEWVRGQDKSRLLSRSEEESPGAYMSDVWDISILAPNSLERKRVGKYPTQKPESLLRRIVESTSNPGDLVLDPACGSGTALAAARDLGRRWLGIDVGEEATRASAKRIGVEAES